MIRQFLTTILLVGSLAALAQNTVKWPDGKKAVIVLTYDDALLSQLDVAIPQLDKVNLKATFFLNEPATVEQIDRWRAASRNGHELGNHTVYHPCHSSKIPTDPRYHSENYTTNTILREIKVMNKFLYALDNKAGHTYAYPCCETSVGEKNYVESLNGVVKYARTCGPPPVITDFKSLDPLLVPSKFFPENTTGEELIEFVRQVQKSNGMCVLLFHGVGGDYLKVSSEAHQQLVQYLKDNNKDIWIATFAEAMDYVSKNLK